MSAAVDLDALVADVMGDFRAFCSLLEIRTKSGGFMPFHYEDWFEEQRTFDRARTGRDIALKPRQVGFTTEELARDLWFALVNRGVNVLIIAHDGDLAEQLFLNLRLFTDQLKAIGLLPRTRYSTKREVVFAETGSAVRIVEAGDTDRAASKKGRSGTVHRLHATEFAFWGAASETMAAVMQSVPADGEVIIESTANGAGGAFYESVLAARSGRSGFKLHFFPWYAHEEYRAPIRAGFDSAPRDEWERKLREHGCDDQQIAWWRSKVDDPNIGLEKMLQEFPVDEGSCFRVAGNTWLPADALDWMAQWTRDPLREAPIAWKGRRYEPARIYAEPAAGRAYVVFGDVSEGVAQDGSAAVVLDRATGETAATWWSDATEPGDFGAVLGALGYLYGVALVGVERNNNGHATIDRLRTDVRYPSLYVAQDGREGWLTNSATRPILFDDLGLAIRERAAFTPDADVVAECKTLVRDKDGKPRARGKLAKSKDSCRDDRFIAWAGAWQMRQQPQWTVGRSISVKGL